MLLSCSLSVFAFYTNSHASGTVFDSNAIKPLRSRALPNGLVGQLTCQVHVTLHHIALHCMDSIHFVVRLDESQTTFSNLRH